MSAPYLFLSLVMFRESALSFDFINVPTDAQSITVLAIFWQHSGKEKTLRANNSILLR